MGEMFCPNCGHHLVAYRTERQSAGHRDVVLQWMICTHCRHVALEKWSWNDAPISNSNKADEKLQKQRGTRRLRIVKGLNGM